MTIRLRLPLALRGRTKLLIGRAICWLNREHCWSSHDPLDYDFVICKRCGFDCGPDYRAWEDV